MVDATACSGQHRSLACHEEGTAPWWLRPSSPSVHRQVNVHDLRVHKERLYQALDSTWSQDKNRESERLLVN